MMVGIQAALIKQHFSELAAVFHDLELSEDQPGLWVVRGDLHFAAEYNGTPIEDSYSVLITLPEDYPNSAPTLQETGGRIPRSFHSFTEGFQCLGAPVDVQLRFAQHRDLLHFVKEQVVPYLYLFSSWSRDNHALPWGELRHGGQGLLDFYNDFFRASGHVSTLFLLRILTDNNYRGHLPCPCGSGLALRKCHGPQIQELAQHRMPERFFYDMGLIYTSLSKEEQDRLPREVLPARYLERLRRRSTRADNKQP